MKKIINYSFLFCLSIVFVFFFIFSKDIKISVLDSTKLWFYNILPSMLPIYIILDLLINYGLGNVLYKLFGTNTFFLFFISIITGSPGNAKYIKEFYKDGLISLNTANHLLTYAYSPNPLFVLAIAPSLRQGWIILGMIYFTNFINYLIFKKIFKQEKATNKLYKSQEFSKCIEDSIKKSFKILELILGIIVFYGFINTFLRKLGIVSPLLSSILEMTNGIAVIKSNNLNLNWLIFACTFAGLSIWTQIKSILEDTDISFKYFVLGRILASILVGFIAVFY